MILDRYINRTHMNILRKSRVAQTIAGAVGLTVGLVMAGGMFVGSASAQQSAADLQSQIQSLLATISALQAQIATMQGGSTTSTGGSTSMTGNGIAGVPANYTFTRNLTTGMTGDDVMMLQKVLNSDPATQVAASGVGSSGHESSYFGSLTKSAVIKFQNKYASDVLTPVGLSAGTGYVGPSTRAKLNQLTAASVSGTTGGTTGGTTTLPTGCTSTTGYSPVTGQPCSGGTTGGMTSGVDQLSVTGPVQPSNSLAVQGAARVPFTNVTLTAGSKDVTVNTITVTRAGLAQDASIANVVLLDENGTQIGNSKTLNSNHQATLDVGMTIPAGTSKTFTVAANMPSSEANHAGEVAVLQVTGVDASSPVSGNFPITGAQNTINATLSLGSASVQTSSLTDASQNLNIGDTDQVFSGIRVTAGSNEALKINSIRWYQSGSAAPSDLSNVQTVVNGTSYPTTVSSDGKYYTTVFTTPISVDKGNNVDMTVTGDIVSGANRTVSFDIYKTTDLNITGAVYGYGITPTGGSGSPTSNNATQELTAGTPWYNGIDKTIQAGTVTSVYKASSVAAQNIAVGVSDQPLGGLTLNLTSEPIQVQTMAFTVATTGTWGGQITNVGLYDQNGNLVAGPVDESAGKVTFTDTVTFPTGISTYTLKGKIPTGTTNGATVYLTTNPSTQWSNITGQITGDTITLTNGTVTMNTMTVKAANATLTVSSQPAAQNVVAGTTGLTMANFQFDATGSGEDVRINSAPFNYVKSNTPVNITNCFAWDGSTELNNTAINPTATSTDYTFNFSNALTIPKGTVKTVAIKCDVPGGLTSGSAYWKTSTSNISATGITSGSSVTITAPSPAQSAGTMTFVSGGSYTVTADASTPAYAIASGGQSGVTLGILKVHANNEDVKITKLPVQLTSGSAADLMNGQVGLYNDSGTQVASAIFGGTATTSIANFTQDFIVPKNSDAKLTIKATLSDIGPGQAGVEGDLVKVDYNGTSAASAEATGQQSGSAATDSSSADTAVDGVRMFNSFPTVAKDTVSSHTLANGTDDLMRFKVTADSAHDIGIYKFTIKVATTGATTSAVNIFGYSNSSYSTAVSGLNSGGQFMTTGVTPGVGGIANIYAEKTDGTKTILTIPAGQTYYFDVQGTVSGASTGDSVQTDLEGDAAYPTSGMGIATAVDSDTNNDFIWSPEATTTATTTADWTNGYGVNGLPGTNLSLEVLSL